MLVRPVFMALQLAPPLVLLNTPTPPNPTQNVSGGRTCVYYTVPSGDWVKVDDNPLSETDSAEALRHLLVSVTDPEEGDGATAKALEDHSGTRRLRGKLSCAAETCLQRHGDG